MDIANIKHSYTLIYGSYNSRHNGMGSKKTPEHIIGACLAAEAIPTPKKGKKSCSCEVASANVFEAAVSVGATCLSLVSRDAQYSIEGFRALFFMRLHFSFAKLRRRVRTSEGWPKRRG